MNTEILNWDSDFFGFKTARILTADPDLKLLATTLENLRKKHTRLVYWSIPQSSEIDVSALGGQLVDRRATYEADLTGIPHLTAPEGVEIVQYTRSIPQQVMLDLAVQAGKYSRFARDPQFPRDKFLAMYWEWMRKSLSHKMADEVLVAIIKEIPAGFVTVSRKEEFGEIGLIAVEADFRGKHIGQALIIAAQNWYREQSLTRARVVTQAENEPACRLYEKCGYRRAHTESVYHFWLEE